MLQQKINLFKMEMYNYRKFL